MCFSCKVTMWCIKATPEQNAAQKHVVSLENLANKAKWTSKTLKKTILCNMSSSQFLNFFKLMLNEGYSGANSSCIKIITYQFCTAAARSLEAAPFRLKQCLINHLHTNEAKNVTWKKSIVFPKVFILSLELMLKLYLFIWLVFDLFNKMLLHYCYGML